MAVSLQISEELKAQIKAIAEAENRTPHWIMHNAIRRFVETYEGSSGSGQNRAPTIKPETTEIINQAIEQRMSIQWADFIEYLDKRLDATAETRLPPGESIFDSWPHDVPDDAPIRRVEKALIEKVRQIKRTTGAKPNPA